MLKDLITIEKEVTTTNAVGTPTESYEKIKDTRAFVKVVSGSTEYSEYGALPFTKTEFTIRYDKNINYKCRINYNDQYYSIAHIEMLGRKHYLLIRSGVWEGPEENG